MPKRIQRKRTKGWRMPEGVVYVGRPSAWGNPYSVQATDKPEHIQAQLYLFRKHVKERLSQQPDWLEFLRGKDLACFCKEGAPCHADILLELANT